MVPHGIQSVPSQSVFIYRTHDVTQGHSRKSNCFDKATIAVVSLTVKDTSNTKLFKILINQEQVLQFE